MSATSSSEQSSPHQKDLKTDIESCGQALSESQERLISTHGSGVVSAVKAVISIYKNTADPYTKAQEAIENARKKGISERSATERRIYGIVENIAGKKVGGMLIAQAKAENLSFLTHDALRPYYGEPCIIFV